MPASFSRGIGITVIVIAVILFLTGCGTKPEAKKNPYEYDVKKYSKIDRKLILYEEKAPIAEDIKNLKGISVAKDDRIFILCKGSISVYSGEGGLVKSFPLEGAANCISAESSEEIFVGMKDHVEVFDASGKKTEWSSLGEQTFITSLAVGNDRVLIGDYGNKQIWLFNKEGNLQKVIDGKQPGSTGTGTGFSIPSPYFDVDFDDDGNIWAANPGRLQLEKYSPEGKLLSNFGHPSMELDGFSGCCNPAHFAVLPNNDFVTVEKGIVRIKLYDRTGKFYGAISGPENFTEGAADLDIAVNSKGDVFVADPDNGKVRVFVRKKGK